MKKSIEVPRFFHLDLWDLSGIESWLGDMAAKGLHFRDRGSTFVWFTRGAPKSVRYRLDAISALSPAPDSERRAAAAELGWQYVDELGDFSVYVCEDPHAPELHTDPVTQSYTMDQIARKLRWELVLSTGALLLLAAVICHSAVANSFSVLALARRANLIVFPALFPLYFLLLLCSLRQCVRLLALRRQLKAGLPMEHRANYRRRARFSAAMTVSLCLLLALYLFCDFYGAFASKGWTVTAEAPAPIAYSLAELENHPDFRFQNFTRFHDEIDYANFVDTSWSPVVPTQAEITQWGEIPGRTWHDGQDYQPRLILHYYKPVFPLLAQPLFHDLLREDGPDRMRTDLDYPGLDEAVLLTIPDGTFTMLLLRAGGRVLWVEYWGEANLAAALPQLARALTQGA